MRPGLIKYAANVSKHACGASWECEPGPLETVLVCAVLFPWLLAEFLDGLRTSCPSDVPDEAKRKKKRKKSKVLGGGRFVDG
jgi:hypothetical protein